MTYKKLLNRDLVLVVYLILHRMKLNEEEMLSLFLSNETEQIKNVLRPEAKRIIKGMNKK